ncbi:hypothetical protein FDP41_007030 [Naegleria fowleri]|uniref:Macro domain-containing protein n=1 Tax=Naegleria fowleri TaxID=5763 RepID=A0A6A5BGX1_NAEFO|nr:uncharacterized protein FDP41_007030 [Naegleria fowleri]KAF0973946.1 hypothetical protein FDP41_007030 [Naegleria fowleri]
MIPTTNNTNDHHHHIMEDSQVSSPPSSSAAAAVVSEDAMQDSQVDESLSTTTLTTTTRTTTTSSSSNNNHNNTPPLPISPSLVGWTEPSTLQEKRSLYACGNDFVTLDQLELYPSNREYPILSQFNPEHDAIKKGYYDYNEAINKKISFFRGDVSQLEIDAVVNAANESLLGGGGIDGAIHRAAGGILRKYNALLNGCDTGCTKISPGFKLPAKYILHTVGPVGENPQKLTSAYTTCLELVEQYNIKSVAFCGISTGIFGYPLDKATFIAMHTVRQWMEIHHEKVDRIIFITFLKKEVDMYNTVAPYFFPFKPLQEK